MEPAGKEIRCLPITIQTAVVGPMVNESVAVLPEPEMTVVVRSVLAPGGGAVGPLSVHAASETVKARALMHTRAAFMGRGSREEARGRRFVGGDLRGGDCVQ